MIEFNVYDDGVIAVTLVAENSDHAERNLMHLGIRWLPPRPYRGKDGTMVEVTNIMGGETELFLLPHTFGAVIGKEMVERKTAGAPGFDESGFAKLVVWLVDNNELEQGMCY
jgi:hypothetical protein